MIYTPFNVGSGILAKMEELGDVPVRSSIWYNSEETNADGTPKVITEFGFGLYHDYRSTNALGDWITVVTRQDVEVVGPPVPPTPEPLPAIVHAIDVSNYQAQDLTAYVREFDPHHIIVRLWHNIEIASGRPHGIAQLKSAKALGKTIGGYGWLYRNTSGRAWVGQCLSMLDEVGVTIPIFWIDVEPYYNVMPTVEDIHSAVEACNYYGVAPGIYTGKWVWDRLGNPHDFKSLPLLHAHYDISPGLELIAPYGGWTVAAGHQYTSTPIDRSIIRREYTVA